jgi:hypothetical protein
MTVEYLAPGVYVEEIALRAHPIEGVPTSTAAYTGVYLVDVQVAPKAADGVSAPSVPGIGRETVAALARLASHAPEWTDFNPPDPGVTLIDLLAFLAETVLYRAQPLPREALPAAARLACASLALASGGKAKPERATLSVAAVVGRGIVEGLDVSIGGGPRVTIGAGTAIGGMGQDTAPDADPSSDRNRAVKRKKDP